MRTSTQSYSIRSVWRGVLEDIPKRRPSFFLTSFVAPFVGWLMVAMLVHFESDELTRISVPLPLILALGLVSAGSLRLARRNKFRDLRQQKYVALLNSLYYGVMLLSLSAYFLRVALDYGWQYSNLPSWFGPALLAFYAFTALATTAWSPFSLPRSPVDDAIAAQRAVKWLPWVMGLQGSLIGLGVFLGAWLMHDEVSWEGLLLLGLASLCALLLLAVTILGVYRFFILAFNPIPPELQEEFGLKR